MSVAVWISRAASGIGLAPPSQDREGHAEVLLEDVRVPAGALLAGEGAGVSDDFPLAYFYAAQRTMRLADGPDEVHKRTIAQRELRRRSDPAPIGQVLHGERRVPAGGRVA